MQSTEERCEEAMLAGCKAKLQPLFASAPATSFLGPRQQEECSEKGPKESLRAYERNGLKQRLCGLSAN